MVDLLGPIRQCFAGASNGREFFSQLNERLSADHGFTPDNTRFAEGACCDEINEPELQLLADCWGERFKFGGLAGYCHGGRTGLGAVSHHVPEEDGRKNLLLVAGPHIGWHAGQWGRVARVGQAEITTSCGALMAILEAELETLESKEMDPLDVQQFTVERIMLPFLQEAAGTQHSRLIALATQFLLQRVDLDLATILDGIQPGFRGQIACITGVTINTLRGNFFCPSMQLLRNHRLTGETVTLA